MNNHDPMNDNEVSVKSIDNGFIVTVTSSHKFTSDKVLCFRTFNEVINCLAGELGVKEVSEQLTVIVSGITFTEED